MEKGAKLDAKDKEEKTPFHIAVAEGSPSVIKILLDAGANRTLKDANGRTPYEQIQ